MLPADLSGDGDPLPLAQGAAAVIFAQETEETDVVYTAGHGVAAGNEGALGQLHAGHGLGLKGDGLALVALGVVLDVNIPDAVIVILQLQVVAVQRVGEDVLHLQLLATLVLKDDLAHAVDRPDGPLPARQRHVRGAAVEEHHVCLGHLVHDHGLHVGAVHLKGSGVDDVDGLVQSPLPGQLQIPEDLDGPHAVILQQDALGLIAPLHLVQKAAGELGLVLHRHQTAVALGQLLLVVLLLAVLTADEHGALAVVEVVHIQGVDKQGGLAAVQKAGDQIERNSGIRHVPSPHASRNSFSSCSSLRSEPMTHRRPV